MRYWLTGPRAGRSEPFVDDLPGFPDNMSLSEDGLLWVAIAAPRNGLLDRLLPLPGVLRLLVWNLPSVLRPAPERVSWVMAYDLDGVLVHDLRSTSADYHFVTAVVERAGELVLSSLEEDDVIVASLPPRPTT
jgi:sugar lactone lactonase YvrE